MKKLQSISVESNGLLSPPYDEILNAWLIGARARRLQHQTIDESTERFLSFLRFAFSLYDGSPPGPSGLPGGILNQWSAVNSWSPNTTRQRFHVVTAIIRNAWELRIINEYPPLLNTLLPRAKRKQVHVLSSVELSELRAWLYSESTATFLKWRVIFELLTLCLRASEITSMTWATLGESSFRIKVKCGQVRDFPIDADLKKSLDEWKPLSPSSWIVRDRIQAGGDCAPTKGVIHGSIKKWFESGPVLRTSFMGGNLFRHSLATLLFLKTENIETVRAYMGHRDVSTTWNYIHIPATSLDESQQILKQTFR